MRACPECGLALSADGACEVWCGYETGVPITTCPECYDKLHVRQTGDRFEVACSGRHCNWSRSARDYMAFCLGGGALGQLPSNDEGPVD